jgi:hypothetical protein
MLTNEARMSLEPAHNLQRKLRIGWRFSLRTLLGAALAILLLVANICSLTMLRGTESKLRVASAENIRLKA